MSNNIEKITKYGKLSELIYINQTKGPTNDKKYEVLSISKNKETGFYAALYKYLETREYIVAFRGTNEVKYALSWYGEKTPQYRDAVKFVSESVAKFNIDKSNLTFTGHSLGGILTAQLGLEFGVKGYTYNPFGANLLSRGDFKEFYDFFEEWANNNIFTISYQDEGN